MGRRPVGQRAMIAAERQRRRRQELTATPLRKAETLSLQTLIRQLEKLLKSAAAQRSAELMADFERQLASEYSWDQDEIWHQAFDTAKRALAEAKAIIATRCEELGIPAQFAPRARHLLACARPKTRVQPAASRTARRRQDANCRHRERHVPEDRAAQRGAPNPASQAGPNLESSYGVP